MDDASSVILCTAGFDYSIRFWEAWSGIGSRTIQHTDSHVNRLVISPDKKLVAVASRVLVRLYDVRHWEQNDPVRLLAGHTGNVTAVAFHAGSACRWILTCSEDGTIKVWDSVKCLCERTLHNGSPVHDIAIHPNGGEVVSCDEFGAIKVWDLQTKAVVKEFIPEPDRSINSLAVALDGSLLLASQRRGKTYAWRLSADEAGQTTYQALFSFSPHTETEPKVKDHYITRTVLSPDAQHLATCSSDGTIKIWSVSSMFKLEKTLRGHTKWVWDAAFSADSAYLVSASSDCTARLWDLRSGEMVRQYVGHTRAIMAVALNDACPPEPRKKESEATGEKEVSQAGTEISSQSQAQAQVEAKSVEAEGNASVTKEQVNDTPVEPVA